MTLLCLPMAAVGSPAHAGIDPGAKRLTRLLNWFPRTRGDRPDAGLIA